MKKMGVEFLVGIFMLVGFLAFAYLSVRLGEFSPFSPEKYYSVVAEFASVAGLKKGADVQIAGVPVGRVGAISLGENNQARVTLLIFKDVVITEDAIASIRTQGIIGDKFIKIMQGGSDLNIKPGEKITETESAVDIEELISKYVFGKV